MQNRAVYIGITGGIGSGKSAVSKFLLDKGYPVIDADVIARDSFEKNSETYRAVVDVFGDEILDDYGNIERARLGMIIFNEKAKRELLNSIVHPAVYNEIKRQYELLSKKHSLIFADVPLLIENNRMALFDEVWVVYASQDIRLDRIVKRDNVSKEFAIAKINSQMSLEEKLKFATRVIYNEGNLEELLELVSVSVDAVLIDCQFRGNCL